MNIDDKQLSNVSVALKHYSEHLNDNKPSDLQLIECWELTRREVWALRTEIAQYYRSLPSSAELTEHVHTQSCYGLEHGVMTCGE